MFQLENDIYAMNIERLTTANYLSNILSKRDIMDKRIKKKQYTIYSL